MFSFGHRAVAHFYVEICSSARWIHRTESEVLPQNERLSTNRGNVLEFSPAYVVIPLLSVMGMSPSAGQVSYPV